MKERILYVFIHFLLILIYSLSQIEYRAKSEALRLREMEQRELERKYGKKKAKEVAEQNFQERIENFEREEFEERRMVNKQVWREVHGV